MSSDAMLKLTLSVDVARKRQLETLALITLICFKLYRASMAKHYIDFVLAPL